MPPHQHRLATNPYGRRTLCPARPLRVLRQVEEMIENAKASGFRIESSPSGVRCSDGTRITFLKAAPKRLFIVVDARVTTDNITILTASYLVSLFREDQVAILERTNNSRPHIPRLETPETEPLVSLAYRVHVPSYPFPVTLSRSVLVNCASSGVLFPSGLPLRHGTDLALPSQRGTSSRCDLARSSTKGIGPGSRSHTDAVWIRLCLAPEGASILRNERTRKEPLQPQAEAA